MWSLFTNIIPRIVDVLRSLTTSLQWHNQQTSHWILTCLPIPFGEVVSWCLHEENPSSSLVVPVSSPGPWNVALTLPCEGRCGRVLEVEGHSVQSYEIAEILLHFAPLNMPIRHQRLMQMKGDRMKMGRSMLAISKQTKDILDEFQLGHVLLPFRL